MALDAEMVGKAKAAEAQLAEAEKAAAVARAEYHTVIRRIHLGGASLREIAAALGMSHQRVQQIVELAGGTWWKPRTRDMICTFCARPPSEVSKLLRGPNVFICDGCIGLAERALAGMSTGASGTLLAVASGGKVPCSFCGKRRSEKRAMVIGAESNVCDACVGVCRQILDDCGAPPSARSAALVDPNRDYVD
jgi:hypothetical protein